jgi:hypothetical protein
MSRESNVDRAAAFRCGKARRAACYLGSAHDSGCARAGLSDDHLKSAIREALQRGLSPPSKHFWSKEGTGTPGRRSDQRLLTLIERPLVEYKTPAAFRCALEEWLRQQSHVREILGTPHNEDW